MSETTEKILQGVRKFLHSSVSLMRLEGAR